MCTTWFHIRWCLCCYSNTMGVTFGAGTANLSEAPKFTPFLVGFVLLDLIFCQVFCRSLSSCPFSFGQSIVCPFWFTAFDYSFGIFKLFWFFEKYFVGPFQPSHISEAVKKNTAKLLQYFKQEFFYRIKCKKNKPKKQHIIISLKRKQKNGCWSHLTI